MTVNQSEELLRIAWFNNKDVKDFTSEDINKYFDWSDKGMGDGGRLSIMKQRQGIILGQWEQGVLESSTPYSCLLNPKPPKTVLDFIKKEMFKGHDSDLIQRIYEKAIS